MFRPVKGASNAISRRNELLPQLKKEKLKKPAKRPITTPGYTRRHFEEFKYDIMRFTHTLQNNNRLSQGRELERDEADQRWTRLIQGIYPADDPKSYELLAQAGHQKRMCKERNTSLMHFSKVECPMYDGYWEKRADDKAFFEREHCFELFAFNKPRRNPSKAQKRKWPGCILMEDHECKEFLIPRISLLALQQVNYLDFVKSVLQANPRKKISRFTMEELWVAIVTKIYHFEDPLDKEVKIGETNECNPAEYRALAEDYRSAYEVAKARVEAKWLLQEDKKWEREDSPGEGGRADDCEDRVEEEEQGIYDQEDRAGKRQKTQESGVFILVDGTNYEAGAQHVGAKQEDVGAFHFDEAAWQDLGGEQGAQATFQFADTGLAFRFKG